MKRTQIYIEDEQNGWLAERSVATGRTKSDLIREAIDRYRHAPQAIDPATRRARWRAAVRATAGVAPDLAPGPDYVRQLNEADRARDELLERRWRG